MSADHAKAKGWLRWWRVLQGKDVLAGLLFIGIAGFGLWVSRTYPVGTASRMGTGYVPRLLLWVLLGLGGSILALGLWKADQPQDSDITARAAWRPVVFVASSLVS
jgi:hypothetical protein